MIWLSGELGAGKTTFTQGLGHGLQVDAPIISPTFVLIREYRGRLPLYHIDLYRLDQRAEIENLGVRDYLGGEGVCVVEWAERYDRQAAEPGLHIELETCGEQTRLIKFSAHDERAQQLLNALHREGPGTAAPNSRLPIEKPACAG